MQLHLNKKCKKYSVKHKTKAEVFEKKIKERVYNKESALLCRSKNYVNC